MDLNTAIQAHGEWKVKLRGAIQRKERVDAAAIGVDDKCPLGQWLHGDAKAKLASLPSYRDCLGKHAAFHKEAGRVAQTINAGDYAKADTMLATGSAYAAASSAVAVSIMALKKEASL